MIPFSELEQYIASHAAIQTVSFDVFDTIVFRRQGTWRAFLAELGGVLRSRGLIKDSIAPEEFATLRLALEKDAHAAPRTDGRRVLTLEEIYEHFAPSNFGPKGSPAELARAEFELEKTSVYALPATIARITRLVRSGRQVCFTSNTYYRREQLTEILMWAGLPVEVLAHVFCSCEYGQGKQHGLFQEVMRELGIAPANIVHCGDNAGTDVAAPAKFDIAASQYAGNLRRWLADEIEITSTTVSDALRTCARFNPARQPYHDFGYTFLGPIITGFTVWLLDLAASEGRRTLVFAEREGIFLKEATDLLLEMTTRDEYEGIRTERIAVSRRSVLPLVVGDAGALDVQTDLFSRQFRLGAANLDRPDTRSTVARARTYLEQHLSEPAGSIFVDIGYKGTINTALNLTLGTTAKSRLLGAYLLQAPGANRPTAPSRGYLPDDDSEMNLLGRSMRGISFLEQCLMPALGSVSGYDADLEPTREESNIPDLQVSQQRAIQEGILAFVTDFAQVTERVTSRLADATIPRSDAEQQMLAMFQRPTIATEDLVWDWVHEVNFGSRQLLPVSAKAQFALIGPAISELAQSRSWIGPIRRNTPLSPFGPGTVRSTLHLSATTTRGPIGPGSVRTAHPSRSPRVARFIAIPRGETLHTLRLSEPKVGSSQLRVQLFYSTSRLEDGAEPTLEGLTTDPHRRRVLLQWTDSVCQIIEDKEHVVRSAELDPHGRGERDLRIDFAAGFPGDAVLVLVEPIFSQGPRKKKGEQQKAGLPRRIARRMPDPIKRFGRRVLRRVKRTLG